MADASQSLKSVLSSLGYAVYKDKVTLSAEKTPAKYLIYQKIGERNIVSMQGRADTNRSRYQIRYVADTQANLEAMIETVRNALVGNRTDFQCALASEIHIENKEAEGVYTAIKDYFVWATE
jgi:hypothetical protein